VPPPGTGIYSPVTVSAVARSLEDPAMPSSGLPQFALSLALLAHGQAQGLWTCTVSDPSDTKSGAVSVAGTTRTAEIFFAANAQAAIRLALAGYVMQGDEAVILHSHDIVVPAARFPKASPGRTGNLGLREFSVSFLADGAVSLNVLLRQFQAEMAL
jgi:hypothetical protein